MGNGTQPAPGGAWNPRLKARPTLYRGTLMRSRLEAGYAAWLDRLGFRWEYEPKAFAGAAGQWLPDFVLYEVFTSWMGKAVSVYVEVKPDGFLDQPGVEDDLARRMLMVLDSEPDALVIIETPEPSLERGAAPGLLTTSQIVGLDKFTSDPIYETLLWCRLAGYAPMLVDPIGAGDGPFPDGWWRG